MLPTHYFMAFVRVLAASNVHCAQIARGMLVAAYCFAAVATPASAADLPIACVAGSCGVNIPDLLPSVASITQTQNVMDVNQHVENAVLNWRNFNISADGTVNFNQPSTSSIALNRIFQGDASVILGALNANGRVYLINQNGILFGDGAKVNVGGLIASSLNITPDAVENGIAGAPSSGEPVFRQSFTLFRDENGNPLPSDPVEIKAGASLTSNQGLILITAPIVRNEGLIKTPDGQTVLAAGESVYLAASTDPELRGLFVEVEGVGSVTNGVTANRTVTNAADLIGQIVAERGNITLAGMAVNQLGRVSATTSIRQNGSIRLIARDRTTEQGNDVVLGERSVTEVRLATDDTATTVDASEQPRSRIRIDSASDIHALDNSRITATAGDVTFTAGSASLTDRILPLSGRPITAAMPAQADRNRIYVAPGASIDVSGASVDLPMERNSLRVELRGSQMADSPVQRDGPLRGQAVYVDVRRSGTREDGTTWVGTPLADVSGDISTIARNVAERSLAGGEISLISQGDVIVAPGAVLDISGGLARYADGFVRTSSLLGADGHIYDITNADRDRVYTGLSDSLAIRHDRWGVTRTFAGFAGNSGGQFEAGYVEGKDAGTLNIIGPNVILDGDVRAVTTIGRLQRQPAGTIPANSLYRPFDQVPLGGRLTLGNSGATGNAPNYVSTAIEFAPGLVLPTLTDDSGEAFDPRRDRYPTQPARIRIRPELFGADRIARASLFSNETATLPAATALTLPAGGELAVTARQVVVDGDIDVPAGSITLTSRPTISLLDLSETNLAIGASSSLSARGQWINDLPNSSTTDPLFTRGGTIRITAQEGDATLAAGSVIDVSGGGWRQASGRIVGGRGGSIAVAATPQRIQNGAATVLDLGSSLLGYSLSQGGELSIAANEVCIAEADCSEAQAGVFWLRPQQLTEGGFGSYRVSSNRGGLRVVSGTQVNPRQQNLEFTVNPADVATGTALSAVTRVVTLADQLRPPTSLALVTSVFQPGGFNADTFASAPNLHVESGATLAVDPGARISLESNSRLLMDGFLSAPGGAVDLLLKESPEFQAFLASQAIWLGGQSRISTAGVAQIITDDSGLRQGRVLNGGTVSITAANGYIIAQPGSFIDVSGTQAEVDARVVNGNGSQTVTQSIASAGGTLSMTAAEGMLLSGRWRADGGSEEVQGGAINLTIHAPPRTKDSFVLPNAAREITLQARSPAVVIGPGTDIPEQYNGRVIVGADAIEDANFDSVRLAADVLTDAAGPSAIRLDGDLSLGVGRQIVFDAPVLASDGGTARLSAPYISIGNSDPNAQTTPVTLLEGDGILEVDANFIDLIGNFALQGFQRSAFASNTDIRLRGVQPTQTRSITGSLRSAGDLAFSARQIYPSTLTNFSIAAEGAERSIEIQGAGGTADDPLLSAGGRLSLTASRILQSGVLRAPFGEISLTASDLVLDTDSITSTSASGQTIPFGTTQGGFDWAYQLLSAQTLIFEGSGDDVLPQQRVLLNGDSVDQRAGSVVDLSGGGDLLAYEFVRGTGGSSDYLSTSAQPGQFAIVPALNLQYAPYDQHEYDGVNLQPGDSVYLSGIDGLEAGTYVLMPARYALLPGAFLVRDVDGYQGIRSGEQYARLDGSTVISGYRTVAGTGFRDSQTSGFAVRPGSDALDYAQYTTSRASEFFAAQAAAAGLQAPRLPIDAGILSIAATQQLNLAGTLRAAAGNGGRGAAVDIAGRLRVVGALDAGAPTDGSVVIEAQALNRLGAESLLLGATRTQTSAGVQLTVSADTVTIDEGAQLQGQEIIIAARDTVTVEENASIVSAGAAARADEAFLISGDGALIRVASSDQSRINRTYAPGSAVGATGTLLIREGATLQSRGSVALDASRDASNAGRLDVAGASLNLSASRVTLGAPPSETGAGLVLSGEDLADLNLDELVLTSRSTIDLYGSTAFNVNRLIIEAGGIVGRDAAAAASISAAGSMRLANQNAAAVSPATSDGGTLLLSARDIELGAGTFTIDGFASTELRGSDRIIADAVGGLSVDGNLSLVANRITTTAAATSRVQATGILSTAMSPGGPSNAPPDEDALSGGLGGRLTPIGRRVDHGGWFELPSGTLELQAVGADAADSVTLASGSVIDLRGVVRDFDGVEVGSPGGRLNLVSANGNVQTVSGSSVDIRGGNVAGTEAGSIRAQAVHGNVALDGALLANATESGIGGSAVIDAWSLGSFGALNRALNVAGVTNERSVRLRGPGDLVVEAGEDNVLTAHDVTLTAEQGSVRVDGRINANGSSGGRVTLLARDNVNVSGTITAVAQADNQRGGRVELQSQSDQGGVRLESSSVVDVSGAPTSYADGVRGGEVLIRAEREHAVVTLFDTDATNDRLALLGEIVGDDRTTLEAFKSYDDDGVIDAADVAITSVRYTEASAFMINAAAIREALGRTDDDAFHFVPGVEIRRTGNLIVNADWNLANWRFDGAPGVLTLRASGNLTFGSAASGGSLSDGFSAMTGANAFLLTNTSDTWSYRLASGADLLSVNTLAVLPKEQLAGAGNFAIANGTVSTATQPATFRMIRTGNGDIDIAAGGNFTLGNRASVVYTAGLAGPGVLLSGSNGLGNRTYPIDGGNISITAQGDVVGAATPQLVTDWLWRVGRPDAVALPAATAWTVNFQRFEQNVGALAGGDMKVRAGGNVDNLSASIPIIGRQVGGATASESEVQIIGGGNLSVQAAGSIRGGRFYVGRGLGTLRAGDAIDKTPSVSNNGLYPILALGDGKFDAVARTRLGIETVLNPTLIPQGRSQAPNVQSYFSTYTDASAVELAAIGGDLILRNEIDQNLGAAIQPSLLTAGFPLIAAFRRSLSVLPPTLRASSLDGDVRVGGSVDLWPAPKGNLELFAQDDVLVGASGSTSILVRMSDADVDLLPRVDRPFAGLNTPGQVLSDWISLLASHAVEPVHGDAAQPDAVPDLTPVRIVAGTGSVVQGSPSGGRATFSVPKAARIVAAGDLVNPDLTVQHLRPSDVTSVLAGGDIIYPLTRSANGAVSASNPPGILVDGPGRLEIVAGGDVDFGTSNGVQTRGNTVNPVLPERGADVSITAGMSGGAANFAAFADRYLAPESSSYSNNLIDYVETYTGREDLDHGEALRLFRLLDRSRQAGLIESTLFAEMRASGRAAAQPGPNNNNFTRAFDAMTTLFPGSNPDIDAGEVNPYEGNISLYFSGVYTLDGGNVSLLAPGGFVNAGLAAPPVDFGLAKSPEKLGVVAQSTGNINSLSYGDFQVNESRVFSADGGDILVWSTRGDIDAGRGAKTAISAPPPTITIDADGRVIVRFPPALTGSGIQTIATTPGRKPGNVDLYAPRGVVNAGDAGIVAGNLTIAATAVLGGDNIQVSGVAVGVPVDAGGLGASLSGVSAVASSASSAATASIDAGERDDGSNASLAQAALSWLEVFVVGLGEDQCEPRDTECLKRQTAQ